MTHLRLNPLRGFRLLVMALFLAVSTFASVLVVSSDTANAASPVEANFVECGLELHLRPFAEAFGSGGQVLRLNTIVSVDDQLVVTAEEGQVFDITGGNTDLLYDFNDIWPTATGGRSLNFTSSFHSGLRGVAFSPTFAQDGKLYTAVMENRPANTQGLHYLSDAANPIAADSVVSEWTVVNGQLDPSSYRELFRVGMPVFDHPIKDLAFGPDGMLYVTHGDGSVQSATAGGGLNNDALGKIIRIDPTPSGGLEYTIPADNPFVGDPGMLDAVWSIGHRNPHTLFFTNDGTLLVGEVGRDNIDEINLIERGGNYGWPEREGTFVHLEGGGIVTGVADLPSNDAIFGYTYPVAQFGHVGDAGRGFVGQAIAGGIAVENGSPLDGQYFYGEFVTVGDVYHLTLDDINSAVTTGNPAAIAPAIPGRAQLLFDHDSNPNTAPLQRSSMNDIIDDAPRWTGARTLGMVRSDIRFGEGPDGEMYISSKRNGLVYLVTSSLPGGPGGQVGGGCSNAGGGGAPVSAPAGVVQAETGTPVGRSGISTEHSGFTGTGFVDNVIGNGSGIEGLTVNAASSGAATLTIRYSAGRTLTETVGVVVNGTRQTQASFPTTGEWSNWAELEVPVTLNAGSNQIDLIVNQGQGDTGWINIDWITIAAGGGGGVPVLAPAGVVQAETGTPVGSSGVNTDHNGFTGTGFVDNLIGSGSGVEGLTVNAASAGNTTLTIRYGAGRNLTETVGVVVNGTRQTQASFPTTGEWSNWAELEVPVTLNAGSNQIDLIVNQGQGDSGWVNIDWIATDGNGGGGVPGLAPGGVIQAETGTPVGVSGINTDHNGFTGTGFIDNLTANGTGVEGLTVNSASSGAATLTIRYGAGRNLTETVGVVVNGTRQTQATFPTTGEWSTWAELEVPVTLNAGSNQIDLIVNQGQGDTGWINIDWITVDGIPVAAPGGVIQAETGTPAGVSGINTNHSGFTGTGFIDNLIGSGSGVEGLTVNAANSGAATLTIRYGAGRNLTETVGVVVNGTRQTQASFPTTGGWSNWAELEVPVTLNAGSNQIDLIVNQGQGDTGWINIDWIAVDGAVAAGGAGGGGGVPVLAPGGVTQAETGTPVGVSGINTDHNGFTGTGFIDNVIGTGSGVQGLTVNAANSGAATLTIRYGAGRNLTETVGVVVNGTRQTQASFPTTGEWSTWAELEVPVTLNAGSNQIDLIVNQGQGDTGWINIDWITVDGIAILAPGGVIQAETGTPAGVSGINTNHSRFTGTGFIDNLIGNGSGVQGLTVNAANSGAATLTIRYGAGRNLTETVGVVVNSARQTQASFPTTGEWSNWAELEVPVTLNAGSNQIDLIVNQGQGDTGWINIDWIAIG